MRVLHVRNSDLLGGPERLILNQCALASDGFTMAIASFGAEDAPHALLDEALGRGIETLRLPQKGSYDPRLIKRLAAAVADWAPDVIVGHDYKADLLLRLAAGTKAAKRVAIIHGYTGENTKVRVFEAVDRLVIRKMDAVVAVSEPLLERLREGGITDDRLFLVRNAIDVEGVAAAALEGRDALRAEWGLAPETVVVLALGRLSPEKGPDLLLEAFAHWQQPSTRTDDAPDAALVFVGDGALRETLEELASAQGVEARVHFRGWRSDPWACLGAADVFALASRREGLPLAVLEAIAARKPIVAARVGGVPHALDEGACGWLGNASDTLGLAVLLHAAATDTAEREARVARAAARVREAFGAERQARELEAIYERITRDPGAA